MFLHSWLPQRQQADHVVNRAQVDSAEGAVAYFQVMPAGFPKIAVYGALIPRKKFGVCAGTALYLDKC